MNSSPPDNVPQSGIRSGAGFRRIIAILTIGVLVLWWFPHFWYTNAEDENNYRWFAEQHEIPGWQYREVPIGESAEAVLVADQMQNGEFTNAQGDRILAYSAKRYLKKENEIGLFSHTPDRCWTAAGWKLKPVNPDYVQVEIHGIPVILERRIFTIGNAQELVYFGALVGGKPLPYRIDQYQRAAATRTDVGQGDASGTWGRLAQTRLWSWAWDCFRNRSPFGGPQQFFRISTAVGTDISAADQLLTAFLEKWLQPTNYLSELSAWQARHE